MDQSSQARNSYENYVSDLKEKTEPQKNQPTKSQQANQKTAILTLE